MTHRNQLAWLISGISTLGSGCTLQDTTGDLHSVAGAAGATSTQTATGGSSNSTVAPATMPSSGGAGGAALGGTGGVSSTLTLAVDNPSGDCGMHYFASHGTNYPWLPDCNLPLKRHYYRLLLNPDGSVNIHPGLPWDLIAAACDDATSPIHSEALHTGSCNDGSEGSLSVVEAMNLVHYLNQQLRFSPDAANQVTPQLIYEDITKDGVDLCLSYAEARSGSLGPICQTLLAWHDTTPPTLTLSQAQATELAQYLNQLYGVDGAEPVSTSCSSDSGKLRSNQLPECPCDGGGTPKNACSQLGLRCTYFQCTTCSCVETLTDGALPTLTWDCLMCPF